MTTPNSLPDPPFIANRLAPEDYPTQRLLILAHERGGGGGYIFLEFPDLVAWSGREHVIYPEDLDVASARTPTKEEVAIVEKARKLLKLGESPNVHEAEAALSALRNLLGRNGLSEGDLRERESGDFGAMLLGEALPKHDIHNYLVGSLLVRHFRVRCIWVQTYDPRLGRIVEQLEVVGKRGDLALAEYVHDWLLRTAESSVPPGYTKRNKADFLAGVITGFSRKLEEQERVDAGNGTQARTSLVKIETVMEAELKDYFDRRHPHVRTSGRGRGRTFGAEFGAGHQIGRGLNMSTPMGTSPGPKRLGKGPPSS